MSPMDLFKKNKDWDSWVEGPKLLWNNNKMKPQLEKLIYRMRKMKKEKKEMF